MAVMSKALKDENVINLITSSKHPRPQFYSVEEAQELVDYGVKKIDWASNDQDSEPDIVFAAAGSEPNLEALAAISILHEQFPEMKIRFINVVDLLKLRHPDVDPRGLSDEAFDELFTTDKPVIFNFHGYEGLIRDIFFTRHNRNLSIHAIVKMETSQHHLICGLKMNWIASIWPKTLLIPFMQKKQLILFKKWIKLYNIIMIIFVKMVMILVKYKIGNGKI